MRLSWNKTQKLKREKLVKPTKNNLPISHASLQTEANNPRTIIKLEFRPKQLSPENDKPFTVAN